MTEPAVIELPPSFAFGKVVGRVIHAIADTDEDVDDRPQARAAAGTVRFTPRETLRKASDVGATAIVTQGAQEARLSATGRILDAEGRQGIWLVAGVWRVTFALTSGASVPDFDVEVTAAATDAAPLDLAKVLPYTPQPGSVTQTLVVPAGGDEGDALLRAADGSLTWGTASSGGTGGTGGTTDHRALTNRDATDQHPIAAVMGLSVALAGKQPAGEYVGYNDVRLTNDRMPLPHTADKVTDLSEAVQDVVGAMVKAGSNVTAAYDDAANTLTLSATATGGATTTADGETIRDTIAAALRAGPGVQILVDDPGDTITVQVAGFIATQISDSTTTGRSVLTGDALAGRTALDVEFTRATVAAASSAASDGTLVRRYSTGGADFSGPVTVGTSTAVGHAARKDYVDVAVAGLRTDLNLRQTAAQVDARVQQVVGAAPAALDTLAEVAAALAESEDEITGLYEAIGARARVQSLTQTQYDALVTKDPNTLYVIPEG